MERNFHTRIVSGLLAILMGVSCLGSTAIAAYAEPASSVAAATAQNNAEEEPDSNDSSKVNEFIKAVDQINYDEVMKRAKTYGALQKQLDEDEGNEDLANQVMEAEEALNEVADVVYDAVDLYNGLEEEDKQQEAVLNAYAVLAKAHTDLSYYLDHPGASESGDENALEDVSEALYDDLPDKPTGYYIGSRGLPVATGEPKMSIGAWNVTDWDQTVLDGSRLDADMLNAGNSEMSINRTRGKDFAIVPVMVQTEYPANNSKLTVSVPDGVEILDLKSTYDNIKTVSAEEAKNMTRKVFTDCSADATGFYFKADKDFTLKATYTDGNTEIVKELKVKVGNGEERNAVVEDRIQTYADATAPTPANQTGRITRIQKVNGTWLIWFNGQEAYCCDHGVYASNQGCPEYSFAYTSKLKPGQYTGDHYSTQVGVWGGLNQLALSTLTEQHSVADFDASEFSDGAATYAALDEEVLETAYQYYDDTQMWIIKNYPNSEAARIYMDQAAALTDADKSVSPYLDMDSGYYTFIYHPPISGWQRVALIGPAIGTTDSSDTPSAPMPQFYATKDGSFEFTFTVAADKIQRNTHEKVDGAVIGLKPLITSGEIDGGSWNIAPADSVSVTTSGHTNDNDFQNNGGSANASWTLSYSVSKSVGPFDTQEEADEEAQKQVDAAIAAAKEQLNSLQFGYDEVAVPYGFDEDPGEKGSHQTVTVTQGENPVFVMNNDEWSLKVNLDKIDSETGNRIQADAQFEVYMWDAVTKQYIPYGDYNQYRVERNADGTYSVRNDAAYADTDEKAHTLYYTQRNEGKFIIAEAKAPVGYFGDWSDALNPGVVNTVLGKRAYYIEITKANDGSVIDLDNKDYSADIAVSENGGTKLLTSGGVTTTVTISKASEDPAAVINYKDPARSYDTDNSKTAANEDEYRSANDIDGKMQNDRVLGEISLSKVDLDAVRYINGRIAKNDAIASGESHGDAVLDGAVYDLYAAQDITHPDGVSGIVDYSAIKHADGTPIWHTTIRENSGHWNANYLPVLAKDNLVASAQIKDGWLTFANLYLGKYYILERGTGVVIPVEANVYRNNGMYPEVDAKTKEPTGNELPLACDADKYTDYVYKNQYSFVEAGKDQDSRKTFDGVYLSYSKGYLCDEHNYYVTPAYGDEGHYIEKIAFEDNRQAAGEGRDTSSYSKYYQIQKSNAMAESLEQVMKADIELTKRASSNGESNSDPIEGAGFTMYLISDLSKADQIATSRSGKYLLSSLWDLYANNNYDQDHPKWDFSGETQAIAKTYECDPTEIAAYNESLTDAGDFANGKGEGWVATGNANEYQLSEIFSNDTGDIRVWGLPYGQYLLVETTVPEDKFQADPVIIDVDPDSGVVPVSRLSDAWGAVEAPSGSYMKYTILNELVEAYLRIVKIDDETGKPVLREGTAFQLYWIDDNGNYILDRNGNPRLVTMTATADGSAEKKVDTFYSSANGMIVLPEKLEAGRYRIVEVQSPEGFYNEWADTAQYGDNGILLDKDGNGVYSSGSYFVDFAVTTDRIYEATGDLNEDNQDNLLMQEEYRNNETLGKVIIRKTGEVLSGFKKGKFTYETKGLAGAEFQIIAAEDILTQDNQIDANGNRTVWYKAGDVVATVTSGDSFADTVAFAPTRTNATYDFLSVIHDGTIGEVQVTLPLGKYTIVESKAPYGYVLNDAKYDVEFKWDDQVQDVNFSTEIKQTVQLESDAMEVPAYSTVSLMVNGQVQDRIMGDVNLDGQITEEDAKMIREYLDEQTYMKEFAQKALDAFNQYIAEHPDEPAPAVEVYEPQHLLSEAQMILANVSNNQAIDPKDGVTYADAEIISAFAKGEIDRMPYTLDHPEMELGESKETFENTRVKDADAEFVESQTLQFVNDREKARVGVYKFDSKTNKFLAGAQFELYAFDDIYNADGEKIFSAGDKIATSPETREDGYTYFDVDVPVRGENYENSEYPHKDNTTNSGVYVIVETKVPDGYYLNKANMRATFTYDGEAIEVLDSECKDVPSTIYVSKREMTGDEELPGATLAIKDKDGNVIREWVSTTEKHEVNALSFKDGNEYTLTETRAADGYALASDITFKLVRRVDDTGMEMDAVDVYYKGVDENGHVVWNKLDDETVIMRDDVTKVKISKKDITNNEELPGAKLTIKDKDGNVVETWTSTNEPHYIEKLPAGDYTLIEESAPNGFQKAEDVKFTVQPISEIQVVTMYDRPDDKDHEYGIQIYKVDAVSKKPLEGVEFRILDAETKKVVKVGKTNAAGNLWFGLEKGHYFYQESKVPSGYLCDTTLRAFSITSKNNVVEIQFENQRSPLGGVVNFLKGTNPNKKTGTLPNGSAVEEVMAISQNTGADVVTATPKMPAALVIGIAIIVGSIAGAAFCFVRRRKS